MPIPVLRPRRRAGPSTLGACGLVVYAGLLSACGDPLLGRIESSAVTAGAITVRAPYALPPFTNSPMPIYLTVANTGSIPDSLLGVSSPVAAHAMLHGGGMEGMAALVVPASGSLALRPGETHLMLEPPLPEFPRGDSVQVTLRFAHAGDLSVWAMVIDYDDLDRMDPK